MNRKLLELGLQIKTAAGWEATDEGSKISTKHSWKRKNKSGYNFKWKASRIKELMK